MYQNADKKDESELLLLKSEAIPFFHAHLEEFKDFVIHRLQQDSGISLWKITLDFISFLNLPFNMKRYMEVQTHKIRRCIAEHELNGDLDCQTGDVSHQKLVADWIRREAKNHREEHIRKQKECLNHFKKQFEEALKHELCTCQIPNELRLIILGDDSRQHWVK